ncbi:YbaK/EbsC family protein [uncultured Clostridium sp.]|uniref:YbaK/EbsC family protein n=1 Tax=uncultured Clostridium sp. TaxID=59620 RepID=UPI0025D1F415|nr:YbaK/EbsC family protein [uncultured Clostridium sp.]
MSIEIVKQFLKKYNKDIFVQEFNVSSATVELAAQALDVEPARIAKTISFKSKDDGCILLVAAGDTKIDNSKFKQEFGLKAKMLNFNEVEQYTGHPVGGVCPFANPENAKVYLDESLKRFNTVFPACGTSNSAIELTCDELFHISNCIKWVDVCKSSN